MSRDQKLLFWEALPSWWLQCTTKCLLLFPALGCVSLNVFARFDEFEKLWWLEEISDFQSLKWLHCQAYWKYFISNNASKSHLKYTVMLMINVFAMSKVSRHEKIQCSKYLVVNTMYAEYEFTHNTAHSNP